MRKFVTIVWRPVVAVLTGVLVIGIGTFLLHEQWHGFGGYFKYGGILLRGQTDPPAAASNYAFLCDWVRPLMWWVPPLWGGAVAGLMVEKRAWLRGAICGLAAVVAFALFAVSAGSHNYFTGWRDNVALAYLVGATAGGALASWITWIRQSYSKKEFSHVT